MRKKFLILFSIFTFSCWLGSNNPAVNSNYNFNEVGSLVIEVIGDFSGSPESGKMVFSNLTHNFLKFGYDVNVSDLEQSSISIGHGSEKLLLSCIITEFTDSKMVVVPFRHEDKGFTKTVVKQSSEKNQDKQKSESDQIQTSTTTTHAGKVKEGNRVEYSQSRIGIMLKMTDYNSGNLVWSNSYWYSGLEMQRTIESCLKTGVQQIDRLFK